MAGQISGKLNRQREPKRRSALRARLPSGPSALRPVAYGTGLRLRRGTPPGFPRLRRLPLPLSCLAYRPGLAYQERGKPRRWSLHRLRTHRAPRQLDSPGKAGLAGKAVCRGRAQPHPPAQAGRSQVERQEKGGQQPGPPSWPASPHPTMTAGKRGSRIVISSEAGPRRTTTKPPRSVQEARNRARPGRGGGPPRKTPLRAFQCRISTVTRSRPGWPRVAA